MGECSRSFFFFFFWRTAALPLSAYLWLLKTMCIFWKSVNTNLRWETVRVEVIAGVLPHAPPVLCVTDNSRWHVAGSLHGPVSNNVRWRLLWWVWWKSQITMHLFPHFFQSHLFFDKVPETVSDMLVGNLWKRIHFLSIVFSLSPGGVCRVWE